MGRAGQLSGPPPPPPPPHGPLERRKAVSLQDQARVFSRKEVCEAKELKIKAGLDSVRFGSNEVQSAKCKVRNTKSSSAESLTAESGCKAQSWDTHWARNGCRLGLVCTNGNLKIVNRSPLARHGMILRILVRLIFLVCIYPDEGRGVSRSCYALRKSTRKQSYLRLAVLYTLSLESNLNLVRADDASTSSVPI